MFTFLQDKSEEREMNNYLDWQNSCQQLLTRSQNIQKLKWTAAVVIIDFVAETYP
jgi:hypothetical protein